MSSPQDMQYRSFVAHHEAAHIVLCRLLGIRCSAVSIEPGQRTDGMVHTFSRDDAGRESLRCVQENCIMLAAGAIAGYLIDPTRRPGDELDKANGIGQLRGLYGSLESDQFINGQFDLYKKIAARIVRERWGEIERIAESLIQFQSVLDSIAPLTYDPINDRAKLQTEQAT